jgi:type II restriction enzyme
MNLKFDTLNRTFSSGSQIARVLTEDWVKRNVYCPSCGNDDLNQFENNKPVADFLCDNCKAEYELKSKKDSFTLKIVDGAYATMIQRINSNNNPSFFFLNYSPSKAEVLNFLVIPKHYFIGDIIERRKPLSNTARRAGWTGCNILLKSIPETGKIFIVRNGLVEDKKHVLQKWSSTSFLANQKLEARGWLIEVLKVVERIPANEFKLADVYLFEKELHQKFPGNNFVKDKIRQQLQVLRDKGLIEFKGSGNYKKVKL